MPKSWLSRLVRLLLPRLIDPWSEQLFADLCRRSLNCFTLAKCAPRWNCAVRPALCARDKIPDASEYALFIQSGKQA
jgi:hypothetical protein